MDAESTAAALPQPDETIDTSGTYCPFPIVEAAKAIRRLRDGGILLVVATDPGIASDMPLWCKATHHDHLATVRDGTSWKSFVRKRGR